MNDKQEGILFTIDCLNSHKYNFDYNLEELIKETKQLQSNWNSLREWLKELSKGKLINGEYTQQVGIRIEYVLDKMNELEGNDNN